MVIGLSGVQFVCNYTSDNKIGRPRSGSPICLSRVWITDWIGRHEVLLPINHKNYNLREKKNSQVLKMPLWNWQRSKWIFWLPSDERKTSLMSVKNATMHEKRTIAQNFAEIG